MYQYSDKRIDAHILVLASQRSTKSKSSATLKLFSAHQNFYTHSPIPEHNAFVFSETVDSLCRGKFTVLVSLSGEKFPPSVESISGVGSRIQMTYITRQPCVQHVKEFFEARCFYRILVSTAASSPRSRKFLCVQLSTNLVGPCEIKLERAIVT